MWRVEFFGKNKYITPINEEWKVEKSKKSINVWNFSKSVSMGTTFIREM